MPRPKRNERRERGEVPVAGEGREAGLRFEALDALLLAAVLLFAMLLINRTGFINGEELWPAPDAIEYSAMAINMDRGIGPVLHFAGLTYPARYTVGYPLLLSVAYPLVGRRPERLCLATAFMALVAVAGLYLLTLWAFDRPSAIVAAMLLATSPYFIGLSTCVLSDVPALAISILAALAFLYALERESIGAAALSGLLVGWAITIRVTNATILIGIVAAVWAVTPRRLSMPAIIAFGIGSIPFPALQAWTDWRYFGSPLSTGYAFWRPDIYRTGQDAFSLRYLFFPVSPKWKHGNLGSYLLALSGLDGLTGRLRFGMELRPLLHSRYALYPSPVAVFAALGALAIGRGKPRAVTIRTIYLGGGFLVTLLFFYLFYFYRDPRFVLPAMFIIFALAGFGIVSTNRNFKPGWMGIGVIVLDAIIVAGVAAETITHLSMGAPDSKIIAEVQEIRPQLAHSVLVTDISLQWLELFVGGEGIDFVGLDTLFAEEAINEYHLHFLYENGSAGYGMPP
ncbi:MAG TPA: glycosyltransferase family 39 protein, partial [Candidatus Binataceae bacterium]|nr:glycosyltransferase family 39 protein [Candidatus Binataceae bacterium]